MKFLETLLEIVGLSLRTALVTLAGLALLFAYLGVLLFGESSLMVLNQLEKKKELLKKEEKQLQYSNQKLQQEYFELKQQILVE